MQALTYLKSAPDGLIAHVYEHIIARRLQKMFIDSSMLPIVDYTLNATTRNTVASIALEVFNSKAKKSAVSLIETKAPLTSAEIKRAVAEISCEEERSYDVDIEVLVRSLNNLHQTPWSEESTFTYRVYDADKSSAHQLSVPGLTFKRKSPKAYAEVTFEYKVPQEFIKRHPEMKPLVMLIIQILAIRQIEIFNELYPSYDVGDDWSAIGHQFRYRHNLSFRRSDVPSNDELRKVFTDTLSSMIDDNLAERLANRIQSTYSDYHARYFYRSREYEVTGQITGTAGWLLLGTKNNINRVLQDLRYVMYDDAERLVKLI